MTKILSRFYLAIAIIEVTALALPAKALDVGIAIGDKTSFGSFNDYLAAIFKFALQVGASLTALMLIYAGYKYITSQGNSTAIGEAKDIVIGSLTGFIMLLLVYFILHLLNLPAPS